MAQTLQRITHVRPRSSEYFTVDGLTKRIGYHSSRWPLALLKELIDNALDAAENIKADPLVEIKIDRFGYSVSDNGGGIPADVVKASTDYDKTVSDKVLYVSPTRGQQGVALKTVYAAPYVLSGENSIVEVHSTGTCYRVEVKLDQIENLPNVTITESPSGKKTGTMVRVQWSDSKLQQG